MCGHAEGSGTHAAEETPEILELIAVPAVETVGPAVETVMPAVETVGLPEDMVAADVEDSVEGVSELHEHECIICFAPCSESVCCRSPDGCEKHWTCLSCFGRHVEAQCSQDLGLGMERKGQVFCPMRHPAGSCTAAYSEEDISLCDGPVQDLYRTSLDQLKEAQEEIAAYEHQEHQVPLALGVEGHCRHVVERILTLGCPKCGQAFVDFQACCALECSRCKCSFCAFCQQAAPNKRQCHKHVSRCHFNPNPSTPLNGKDLFCRLDRWQEAVTVKRRWATQEHLVSLAPDIRAAVLVALRRELEDVGMDEEDFSDSAIEDAMRNAPVLVQEEMPVEDLVEEEELRFEGEWVRVNGRWVMAAPAAL